MVLWNEVQTGDTLWQCVLNKGNILVSVAFFITQPVNLAPESMLWNAVGVPMKEMFARPNQAMEYVFAQCRHLATQLPSDNRKVLCCTYTIPIRR